MAKKPASNGSAPSSLSPEHSPRPLGPLSVLADKEKLKQREEDVTKINNMNASDLKNACDDALKRVRSALLLRFVTPTEPVSCPPVSLPPRTVSSKPHSHRRAARIRLVVRPRRFRYGVVWLEDRFRKVQAGRVGRRDFVRQNSFSISVYPITPTPLSLIFQVCYSERRANALCIFHRARYRVPGETQNLRQTGESFSSPCDPRTNLDSLDPS